MGFNGIFFLDMASEDEVKFLIDSSQFDICLEEDGVISLDKTVEEFGDGNGFLILESFGEVIAFEHSCDSIFGSEGQDFLEGQSGVPC